MAALIKVLMVLIYSWFLGFDGLNSFGNFSYVAN